QLSLQSLMKGRRRPPYKGNMTPFLLNIFKFLSTWLLFIAVSVFVRRVYFFLCFGYFSHNSLYQGTFSDTTTLIFPCLSFCEGARTTSNLLCLSSSYICPAASRRVI